MSGYNYSVKPHSLDFLNHATVLISVRGSRGLLPAVHDVEA
jgi:hypothetical protein